MNGIEYIESEKIWRAPNRRVESSSLGEDILKKLKQSDPQKVFEVLHDTGTNVTVKEIRHQTITVAQNLLDLGVKKGDNIVFFSMLNLKITPLTYACYTIGAPVCFFETYLEDEHTPGYLEMLDPSLIIYQERFKSMIFKALEKLNLQNLKHLLSLDGEQQNSVDQLLFRPPVDIECFQAPSIGDPKAHPAILGFTSGSTGMPKIIINSHAMIRQSVYNFWQAEPGSVVMILSELRWCCQVTIMIQPALLDVKRIYSSTPPLELTPEFVRNMIDTHKVTHYFDVPRFTRTVFEDAERSKNPSTLSSLKFTSVGGEHIGEAFEALIAKITPNCKFGMGYGMTEAAGEVSNSEMAGRKSVKGSVLRNGIMVKILDTNKKSLGPNEIGRVCVKVSAPFLGYLKNEIANKESFIEGGWFDPGDLGMMDSDNLLNIFTRDKYILRYANGKILMPNTVENICNNFEGVYSSTLVGNPSAENPKQDCGTIFLILKSNTNSRARIEKNFNDYLREKLTKEQLEIVKYFKFIEDMPQTTCFKADRIALKGMVEGGFRI